MTWIDILFIGIIGLSIVISLFRGFVKEALSLVTWGAAIWIAIVFSPSFSGQLQAYVSHPEARVLLAFVILLLGTLIAGGVVGIFIGKLVSSSGLYGTDRLLGVFFGFGRGILLAAGLALVVGFTPFKEDPVWTKASLVPYFNRVAAWLMDYVPQLIDQTGHELNLSKQEQ